MGPLAEFKEQALDLRMEDKPVVDLATYYVDGENRDSDEIDSSEIKAVKTYFGPPSARKYTLYRDYSR